MVKMKTVIGFDSWTEGAHNFSRLVSDLKKVGIDLKLIHIGSWGHDKDRPLHEMIGDLPVYDIAYFENDNILEVLRLVNPSAIIFLSTEAFVHQAVNRYAALLDIPTLHLYHGLISVQAVETGHPDHINFIAQVKLIINRFWKNLTKLLPVYLQSLVVTRAAIDEWLEFFWYVIRKAAGRYTKVAPKGAKTQYCAVYTSADIEHASNKYRVVRENIRVVGNPDLIKFGLDVGDFGKCCTANDGQKKIMYIDHGGSTCALTFKSAQEFIAHLELTSEVLNRQGYTLIVKMHPSQGITETPELVKKRGIELSSNASFIADLRGCCAAIVGPSTASLIPSLMGLPLLLSQYGAFAGQEYGKVLLAYPRSILLKEIDSAHNLLANENETCDPAKVLRWISENAGPLPAEQMPERVAAIVVEMIAGARKKVLS